MNAVENILELLDNLLGAAPYFPFVLLGVGLFFTLYLGFPQIRYFGEASVSYTHLTLPTNREV